MAVATVENPGTVDVRFGILLGATGMVCEPDGDFAAARPAEFSLEDLRGQIELRHDNDSVVVEDEIVYLAWKLCLEVAPRLMAQQASEVRLYLRSVKVRLEPQGDLTLVDFAGAQVGAFPTAELARALVSCAQRLAKTLAGLAGAAADVRAAAEALEKRSHELKL